MMRHGPSRRLVRVGAAVLVALAGSIPVGAHATSGRSGASGDGGYAAQIVNGTKSSLGRWPYIVGILQKDEPSTYYAQFCDGSLVAPTIVLSAAHCTFDGRGNPLDPADVDVLVNADDLSTSTTPGDHEGQRIDVVEIVRDPQYNASKIWHDYALFKLASPAPATPVTVVPPSSDYRWAGGRTARVAGFGCAEYDADPGTCTTNGYPLHLRETPLPMLADKNCTALGGVYARYFSNDTMVCAGSIGQVVETKPGIQEGTAKSPCFGDSGGPLVVEGPAGVDLQVGVVSWGPQACGIGPGVFSRLGTNSARAWLRANGVPVGRAAFSSGPAFSIGGNFTPVAGDFDGDGRDDILWYAPGSGRDFLWRGSAAGLVAGPRVSMGGAYKPVAGDFDGDGRDDVFWFGPGAATDFIWYGTPTGFTRGPTLVLNRHANPVAGDFDGDGLTDVLLYSPGTAAELLLRGDAVAGLVSGPPVANNGVYVPVAGDFDGDGKTDIVWYGVGGRFDMMWRGTAGGFQSAGSLTIGGRFRPVAGDFDGDGKGDVLWFSPAGGDLLRRGTASGFESAPEVVIDGERSGVSGDFDGDGRADVVWYGAGKVTDLHWRGAHR
jgi:secreted trypsin-like serine protease